MVLVFTIDESRDEVYPILNWKFGRFRLDDEWFPVSTVGIFAIFIFVFSTTFHGILCLATHFKELDNLMQFEFLFKLNL